VCNELKPVVADIMKQAPIEVDYMTTLTGVQAMYFTNRCLLNYNYVVDADVFLKEMMDANSLSKEENISFLNTEEGINTVKSVFGDIAKNAASAYFQPFSNIKGITITYSYSFDNPKIPSLVANLIENKT
jgi:hypothetical protein